MVLSEENLKIKYKKEPFSSLKIEKGTLLTPSARQFLNDKKIKIEILTAESVKKDKKKIDFEKSNQNIASDELKYIGERGEYYFEKPDYMTELDGVLVFKNNQRVIFRGKLELFLAELFLLGKEIESFFPNEKLKKDIESIIKFTNNILVAEKLNQILENQILLDGKSLKDIQIIFHNPVVYLKKEHLLEITLKNNILIHKLNRLKALSRELETLGVEALVQINKVNRKDLLEALNVLSSVISILIIKSDSGIYGKL